MPTAPGIRASRRAATEAEILRIGKQHLATVGAAALSLRAVARDLGVASSAVYRYVASRDELLTLLIVDAYDSLADFTEARLARRPRLGAAKQFAVIAHALRDWSAEHPHEFALIYGSPVPGYDAPDERTTPAGTRVARILLGLLGGITSPVETARDRVAIGDWADLIGVPPGLSAGRLRRGVTAWTLIVGAVCAERFEQFGKHFPRDPDAYFDAVVDDALTIAAVRSPR